LDVYQSLATGDAAKKAKLVLELVLRHPEGRLELPAIHGTRASLDGIDLGRECLAAKHDGAQRPSWWNADRQSVHLKQCNLQGASIRYANLHGALLEEANFAGADLVGTNLQGANLSGADLRGTLLEDADLRKSVLRFARGAGSVLEEAKLQGADLWGAEMQGANLSGANLEGATLEEACLEGADFSGADLRGANFKRANLKGANFKGADLRGAVLGGANLAGAILKDAKLQELDLKECALTHVHTSGCRLEKTRMDREQLGGAIGEELGEDFGPARQGYLVLERNFVELGDHDAARWAYLKRRRMEKRQALAQARAGWAGGQWGQVASRAVKFAGDQLVEWVCDYGESVSRVIATFIVIYLVFIPLYAVSGTVLRVEHGSGGASKAPTYDLMDLALFSMTSMTSPGNPPGNLQARNELTYLLAGVQTALSIFLAGLMGFVAGNRIRR